MPPGGIAGMFFSFSGRSVTNASVVKIIMAIEAAFCKADLVTFTGSIIPAVTKFSNLEFRAFKPISP